MLATFLGLGVIRRVSRLLHTPLMSLTNAISAIAVVGAILIAGERIDAEHGPGRHRPVRLDDQHRQRLPDHRPHAQDVQEAGAGAVMETSSRSPTSVGGAVHLLAELDERPEDRAPRRVRRRRRDGAGGRRHAAPPRDRRATRGSWWRSSSARSWAYPLSRVPLTAVPQRTALSHAFGGLAAGLVGHRQVLPVARRRRADAVPHRGDRRGSDPRLPDLHRQPDGRRQAAGSDADAAGHVSRPEHRQLRAARRSRSARRRLAGDRSHAARGCSRSSSCSR